MRSRRLLLTAILIVTLVGSAIAWTGTSAAININITAGGGGDGKIVSEIIPIGETFSIARGNAQKISGVELYKITLSDAQLSNLIRVNIAFLNPNDVGKVLNSPNSFIQMQVYYPGTGEEEVTLDYDGTKVLPDTGTRASAFMSREVGDITLLPSVIGQTTLYILASINTPAGPPPGQQDQLTELKFYIDIRL